MSQGLYILAFLDFQKHGARDYNELLRIQTATEIEEADWKLKQTIKQMKANDDWFYYLAYIRAAEFSLYFRQIDANYKPRSDCTIAVYDITKEDFTEISLEEVIEKATTIWE